MTETGKARILCVDDEKKFVKAIAEILTAHGFEASIAFSGDEALEVYAEQEFDLLLTDLNMPGTDGIELIREVRKRNPAQRIIVVTGFPSTSSQEAAFKLGTLDYVVKPFSSKRFLELVDRALENGNCKTKRVIGAVELAVEDLIQMYALEGKTTTLMIRNGNKTGRINFQGGRIVHAETENNKGEEAVYEIQSWGSGVFNTLSYDGKGIHTIENKPVDALLLEGARLQDEQNHSKFYAKEANMAISNEHLSPFADVEGIRGVVVYTESGELLLNLMKTEMPLPPEAIAAFGAELSKFSSKVAGDLQLGTAEFCRVETPEAVLIHRTIESGAIGLSVIADSSANVGMVIFTMNKVIEALKAEVS